MSHNALEEIVRQVGHIVQPNPRCAKYPLQEKWISLSFDTFKIPLG